MAHTYRIVRSYQSDKPSLTVKRGLSLEAAQEHCRNPETSSSTATERAGVNRTTDFGPWFDGYTEE